MSMNGIFDGAKPYEAKASWIGPGTHELRLISFSFSKEFEVKFLVEKSDFHKVGSEVISKWNPYKTDPKGLSWPGDQDRDRAFGFVMQLFGLETTDLVSQYADKINNPDNPASGMTIKAIGVQGTDPVNKDGTPKLDGKGNAKKAWTEVSFYHMADVNTAEAIAAGRARIAAYVAGQLQQAAATPAAAFAVPATVPGVPLVVPGTLPATVPAPVAVAPVAVAQPAAALPGLPGLPG